LDEGNPTFAGFGSGQWFWFSIIEQVAAAGKMRSSAVHLHKRV
jgi:hypothetical protein